MGAVCIVSSSTEEGTEAEGLPRAGQRLASCLTSRPPTAHYGVALSVCRVGRPVSAQDCGDLIPHIPCVPSIACHCWSPGCLEGPPHRPQTRPHQQGSWQFLRMKYRGMEKYNLIVQKIPDHPGAKSILECVGEFQSWMGGKRELMCPDLFFSLLPHSSHLTRCFSFITAVIELKAEDRSKFLDALVALLS